MEQPHRLPVFALYSLALLLVLHFADDHILVAGQHAHGHTGKHQKGSDYDATGGAVDDRSALQKIKDKLTPGSDVGKHTKQ